MSKRHKVFKQEAGYPHREHRTKKGKRGTLGDAVTTRFKREKEELREESLYQE